MNLRVLLARKKGQEAQQQEGSGCYIGDLGMSWWPSAVGSASFTPIVCLFLWYQTPYSLIPWSGLLLVSGMGPLFALRRSGRLPHGYFQSLTFHHQINWHMLQKTL